MMDLIGTLVARCFFGMVVLPVGRSVVALEAGVAVLRAQPQPHGRQPD